MSKIKDTLVKGLNKTKYLYNKHDSAIWLGVSLIAGAATIGLTVKATLDVKEITSETSKNNNVTDEEAKKNKTVKVKKIVKAVAPAVATGLVAGSAALVSHKKLKAKYVAVCAAYKTLDTSFKEYRKRVADKYGEDAEREIRYNIHDEVITETEVDEKGNKKEVQKTVKVSDPNLKSDYAMYFTEETSENAQPVADYNETYIKAASNYWTTVLQAKGFVTLNDVRHYIGMKYDSRLEQAGMVVGWKYDKDAPVSDNIIDLRPTIVYVKQDNGIMKKTLVIDPNVQGEIYSLVGEDTLENTQDKTKEVIDNL